MTEPLSLREINSRSAAVAQAGKARAASFDQLLKVAGLDPARDLCFENWSGVSFAGLDLTGYDFTGALLHGCDFTGAKIAGARFDQAELGRVLHRPERDPHAPAESTPIADLRKAADWNTLADPRRWKKPGTPLRDEHLRVGAIFRDAPFAPELVVVPSGTFRMGSKPGAGDDDERPDHDVTIAYRLAVGRFALTFEEWDAAQDHPDWKRLSEIPKRKPNDRKWGRDRRPVINVNWHDARAYARWLSAVTGQSYRLLTEAEWEYCCRAGTTSVYSVGDEIKPTQAQFRAKSTAEVGLFPGNGFGLHDMHGNVWEWVEDAYRESYDDAPDDGRAVEGDDTSLRVLRGGSWVGGPQFLRSAYRYRDLPDVRDVGVGFRLARTLLPH